MPQPMINRRTTSAAPTLRPGRVNRSAGGGTRFLTTPRSRRYLEALAGLDPSATVARVDVDDVVARIHKEFDEAWASVPLGIVSRCYLGVPYEVHTLTLDGSILAHYKTGEALPGPLERARSLACAEAYLAIEVYPDRMIFIRTDGTVTVSGGGK